jgi:uncharacterized membrane protein (UPF0127 family)
MRKPDRDWKETDVTNMSSSRPPRSAEDVLASLRSSAKHGRILVRNLTRNTELADKAELAGSGAKRSKGLLGRKGLARGEGMWIVPCEAVHTFFMQFPIDLVYLDRKLRIKKIRGNVRPWRISACVAAHSVIELPAGTIRDTRTERGDTLEILDAT